MIKSMTGYGRAQQLVEGWDIAVELKAVNHRYYEFSARMPRAYGYLEEKLKNHLAGSVSRGKLEASVTIQATGEAPLQVQVNRRLAESYVTALRQLGQELGVSDDLALSHLVRIPDLFVLEKGGEEEEKIWQMVRQVADEALRQFLGMRQAEGAKLEEDLSARLKTIEALVGQVEEQSPRTTQEYRERLYRKLSEVLADSSIDESRILTEAAIFAEKTAVDEETVRLRSHVAQFRTILARPEPAGRKLDFLVQEMNREANTIGSKAQDVAIAKVVVALKAEIEKIREQIQNIE